MIMYRIQSFQPAIKDDHTIVDIDQGCFLRQREFKSYIQTVGGYSY